MQKVILLLSVLFCFSSCEEKAVEDEPASFTAYIDGERIQFQKPKVLIKRRDGLPYTREIIGEVSSRDSVERVLRYLYSGDLDGQFSVIMGTYYENNYKNAWSSMPMEIELLVSYISDDKVSGSFSDFDASAGGDTVRISGAKFVNLPIYEYNL